MGKSGSRFALLTHDMQCRKPRARNGLHESVPTDPVHRRVDARDVAGTVRRKGDHGLHVGLGDLGTEQLVGIAARQLVDPTDTIDRLGDVRVLRRHDLARVGEIDLVAVVLRRVVRRGHHDAGAAAEVADREGQNRSRKVGRQQVRVHPRAFHDLGGVAGEDIRVVPRVVSDNHRGPILALEQVGGQARGGLRDDHPVHAVGSSAKRSAQTGGTELQASRKAVLQLCEVVGVDQGLQLFTGGRIRILADPRAGLLHDAHRQILGSTSASRVPIREAAALPASSTSAWLSGSPEMPAARLVTSESPEHLHTCLASGDGFEHGRHSHEVTADRTNHRDLGRGLVVRAWKLNVDAFVERRVDLLEHGPDTRRIEVGQVNEVGTFDRRRRREVDVVLDQDGRAGLPRGVESAATVGQHDRADAGSGSGAHSVDDRGNAAPLVEVGAAEEDQEALVAKRN